VGDSGARSFSGGEKPYFVSGEADMDMRFYCPGCDKFVPEEGSAIAGSWYCDPCKECGKDRVRRKVKKV
jgi:ribosomal protein L37AE/L43A